MAFKWRVFKEKLPAVMKPMWVVWDESGEYLFRTGQEALVFVDGEIRKRKCAKTIRDRQEAICGDGKQGVHVTR